MCNSIVTQGSSSRLHAKLLTMLLADPARTRAAGTAHARLAAARRRAQGRARVRAEAQRWAREREDAMRGAGAGLAAVDAAVAEEERTAQDVFAKLKLKLFELDNHAGCLLSVLFDTFDHARVLTAPSTAPSTAGAASAASRRAALTAAGPGAGTGLVSINASVPAGALAAMVSVDTLAQFLLTVPGFEAERAPALLRRAAALLGQKQAPHMGYFACCALDCVVKTAARGETLRARLARDCAELLRHELGSKDVAERCAGSQYFYYRRAGELVKSLLRMVGRDGERIMV